eukprot:1143589-Pelagomonas_calceolata.AAC.2
MFVCKKNWAGIAVNNRAIKNTQGALRFPLAYHVPSVRRARLCPSHFSGFKLFIESKSRKEKKSLPKRPRALRKGSTEGSSLTSKLEKVSPKGPQT